MVCDVQFASMVLDSFSKDVVTQLLVYSRSSETKSSEIAKKNRLTFSFVTSEMAEKYYNNG